MKPAYLINSPFNIPRFLVRVISLLLCFCLFSQEIGFCQTANPLSLFSFSRSVGAGQSFRPVHLRYLSCEPEGNKFTVLLDKGSSGGLQAEALSGITENLLKYFLTGISLPDSAMWVNLRPGGQDNMIDEDLAKTDTGRILLEADLMLKKDFALATSPNTPEGREYWASLYRKASELYGETDIEIPTALRPWIVPGEIIIRQTGDSAYIYKATLKVMLEQDYFKTSPRPEYTDPRIEVLNTYSSQLLRGLIAPKITRSINADKRYAALRQVYYSLILAQWFKRRYGFFGRRRDARSNADFVANRIDSRDLVDLTSKSPWSKTKYFAAYKKSFQKGEYNIQEQISGLSGLKVRQYFSGGMDFRESLFLNSFDGGGIEAGNSVKIINGNPWVRLAVGQDKEFVDVIADGGSEKGFSLRINELERPQKRNAAVKLDGGSKSGIPSKISNNWVAIAPQAAIAGLIMTVAVVTALTSSSSAFWVSLLLPAVIPVLAVLAIPFLVSWIAQRSAFVKKHQLLMTIQLMLAAGLVVNLLPGTGIAIFEPIGWFWHRVAEVWLNNSLALPGLSDFFRVMVLGLMLGNTAMLSGAGKSSPRENATALTKTSVFIPWAVGLTLMVFMGLTGFPGLLAVPYAVELFTIICSAAMILPQLISHRGGQEQVMPNEKALPREPRVSSEPVAAIPPAKQEKNILKEGEKPSSQLIYPFDEPIEHTPDLLLGQWETELASGEDLFARDRMDIILNTAKYLMSCSLLSKKLISDKPKMEEAYVMAKRFAKLSAKTSDLLLKEWRKNGLSGEDEEKIIYGIRFLLDTAKYNLEYEHALHLASITTGISNYYSPRTEWTEQFKMMPLVRRIWGMRYAFEQSKREFFTQLDKAVRLGNYIEPYLYVENKNRKDDIEEYFKSLSEEKTKENQFKYNLEFGGKREMWTRFLPLILASWPFLGGLLGLPLNFATILFGLATGLGVSVGFSWWHIWRSFADDFYYPQSKALSEFTGEFRSLTAAAKIEIPEEPQEVLKRSEYGLTLRAFDKEMVSRQPSADVVFVLTRADQINQIKLRSAFAGDTAFVIRGDVPVIFVPSAKAGSGNAFFDLYSYKHSEEFARFKNSHQRLKNIPVERLRSVVVLSNKDMDNTFLSWNPVSRLKRKVKILEFGIMNGYKGTQELQAQDRPGEIFIFSDGLYCGPIRPRGDITLLSSWMSQRQIQEQQFGLILADVLGTNRIRKFYEKLDFETIKNKLELASLRRYFDWDNPEKQQFLGFSGGIIVSFTDPGHYDQFIGLIRAAKELVEKSNAQYSVRISLDVLVPLIMLSNKEKIFTYFGAIHDDNNGKVVPAEEREFYHRLFELYSDAYSINKAQVDLHANIPSPGEAWYLRIDGSDFQEKMLKSLTESIGATALETGVANPYPVFVPEPAIVPALDTQPRFEKSQRLEFIKKLFNDERNSGKEFSVEDVLRDVFVLRYGPKDASLRYATAYRDLEFLVAAGVLAKEKKQGQTRNFYRLQVENARVNSVGNDKDGGMIEDKGGIDFRSLPIGVPGAGGAIGPAAMMPLVTRWDQVDQNIYARQIEGMIRCSIVPPVQLVQSYFEAAGRRGSPRQRASMSLFCVSEILRLEEGEGIQTDPDLLDMLGEFESRTPVSALKSELSRLRLSFKN